MRIESRGSLGFVVGTPQSEFEAAMAMQCRGDLAAAEAAYRTLIERHGTVVGAEHMLALTLHAQGRSAEAVAWFERACNRAGNPTLWSNYAAALLAQGHAAKAVDLCRCALQEDRGHFGAWLNLGLASEIERNFGEAVSALESALQIKPDHPGAARALARCRMRIGMPAAALHALARLAPNAGPAEDLLRCEAWIECGDVALATACLRQLARHESTRPRALLLQARIAKTAGSGQVPALLQQVLALDSTNRDAGIELARFHIERGDPESGLQLLRARLESHPEDRSAANIYLFACQYSSRIDAEKLLAEHRRWRPTPAAGAPWPAGWQANSSRKLRIGWVSAHDGAGLLDMFFDDVRGEITAQAGDVEQVFYALRRPAEGSVLARECRYVGQLGDRQLLERIRADGIDILIDMVGRARGNRLAVFAARAAPVQIAWFDAFQTSGVEAMDYLITDPRLSPEGAEAHFSEKLLRLPYGRLVYNPPPAPPPRADGTASRVFVSLNRFAKLNAEVIAAWARILRELPDWTLRLKGEGGNDADCAAALRRGFVENGIDSARIAIEGRGTYAEAMDVYQASAIALDPFPFSGCATTYDALWMGLPVITWPRDTLVSRQTAALLESIGRTDWVAHDADSYVACAVALARDEAARREWCLRARERVLPALCDTSRFVGELLDALRSVALPRPQR